MVSILTEPAYGNSMWCKALLASLTDCLKQKRIPFCEVFEELPAGCDCVFIIAANYNWIKQTLCCLNAVGIKPILLCNQAENITGYSYSCVCSDIVGSMRFLLQELKAEGKTKVALYGVNTESISDIGRVDGLFALKQGQLDSLRVFVNEGSLNECFKSFYPVREEYDAVICTNDFAAISLIRNLKQKAPEILPRLKIFSCSQTNFSAYYQKEITTVNMNFEHYGKAAVFICEKLKNHPYMSGMTITINWNMEENKSALSAPVLLGKIDASDIFYADREMREMILVEQILSMSSKTDRIILDQLVNGATIEKTAQQCFLTGSGVKYRIKRILQECGLENKTALTTLLQTYLGPAGSRFYLSF